MTPLRAVWRSAAWALLVLGLTAHVARAQAGARFELSRDDVLIDEPIPIIIAGVTPNASVTVRLRGGVDNAWSSNATFTADGDGRVDLTRMAPVKGSYKDVDAMGLFWSAERPGGADASPARRPTAAAPPTADDEETAGASDRWTLTAEVGNSVVAQATIRRRAVAANVRVTPVRVDGFVGVFYEPPGEGHHPAMLVLSGSGGGIPPAAGAAGGLSSRGYAVLALAYFGVEGLPSALSDIPLEYFGKALHWLADQPSVDREHIGVLGASRGAELALLLGVAYPGLRTVVAYMPSNVVWRGCCDITTDVAWTLGGRPIAAMPPAGRRRMGMDTSPAEIPVEKMHGPVLLVSGTDDGVWESAPMAGRIVSRLKRYDFKYPVESLSYDHAGHSILRPYSSTMNLNRRHPLTGRIVHMGGTPIGNEKAREDSWRHLLTFLDHYLRAG
jgi:dienelactone hydrolase